MQDEQLEILDFLRRHAPFDGLSEERLHQVTRSVDVRYVRAGTQIVDFGQPAVAWHVVRSGAVEVFRRDGSLYNRLTEGGYFGEAGLLQRRRVRFPARALDDSLLYLIPEAVFTELFENDEHFADIVETEDRTRLRQVVSRREESNPLLSATVESLLARQLVTIASSASAAEAAALMTENQVSALLIVEGGEPPADGPRLVGIVTDRDFRSRLVAQGSSAAVSVSDIMTRELVTIDHQQLVFEAMMQMLRGNIHHLPVLRREQPVGVIALSDVIRYESHNSLFVVGSISRQTTVDGLATLLPAVHASFTRMVSEGASSRMVGTSMAVIGRSFKQRLLELAEAQLGPPPVPYCFLALGSMARHEQLIVTDQDNALILDDRFVPAQHDGYFKQLADIVSDGLARCGYAYCSGGVMASNPRWRQPLRDWEDEFTRWIEQPTPQSLLDSNIFFDIDGVWGRTEWPERLRAVIARKASGQARFLASMARNALLRTPPIGFFKEFVVEADGRHSEAINLKRRGTAPMTDLIRVHALAVGSRSLNSFERLQDVIAASILPPGRGQDLHDALEFISTVRIRNQADDLAAGREPDNSVEPAKLSAFERKSLRDAFSILADAQGFLKFRYQSGRAG